MDVMEQMYPTERTLQSTYVDYAEPQWIFVVPRMLNYVFSLYAHLDCVKLADTVAQADSDSRAGQTSQETFQEEKILDLHLAATEAEHIHYKGGSEMRNAVLRKVVWRRAFRQLLLVLRIVGGKAFRNIVLSLAGRWGYEEVFAGATYMTCEVFRRIITCMIRFERPCVISKGTTMTTP